MDDIKLLIGKRVRELREKTGLTQKELAKKSGTKTLYISAIENNYSRPSFDLLTRLAKVFNVSISYFIAEKISFDKGNLISLPLIGRICAGSPVVAEQNIEEYISLPKEIAKDGSFLLKVTGDSMEDVGIKSNDLLIIRQQPTALAGDIVIAQIDDDIKYNDIAIKSDDNCCVLRRFFKKDEHIELRAENKEKNYPPIKVRNVVILGKVIGRFGGVI